MSKLLAFFKKEIVFTVALIAALLSFLMVPPGMHTLQGIDTTTLFMLFALMTVVAGLRAIGLFDKLGAAMTGRISTLRGLTLALVIACFFLSMVATNDVALITLVPFTLLLMKGAPGRDVILAVVLETIAANLGSMVTPIGNPQNLYLYSSGQLQLMDFPRLTWPYALLSLVLLALMTGLISPAKVEGLAGETKAIPRKQGTLYAVLAVIALLAVAKVIPAWAAALCVLAGVAVLDRGILRQVDFVLLGTFVCFFVFVASIKEYAPVRTWLEGLMAQSPMLVSLLTSQVISNVPACLLLSPFTADVPALMLGVNLGGLGTLVASLASLISFKLYGAAEGAKKGSFMLWFTGLNAGMLAVLLVLAKLLGAF
ncbi:MAG: anion permease [Clostridia bacterium]|nr:anion permease [Clostridia bacterium]